METSQDNQPSIKPQKLELPKGGGAIKGISESFETNFFTGSGSFSIPIALPACRSLTPSIGVGYSSGSGNSSFGIGFNVSVGSIFRKTSRKVPTYDENDVFVLSGSDDLVKVGELYQPRVEGSFAKIERKENYWQVTDKDGSVSIYGKNKEAQIYDPENDQHIAEWLLEETTDTYGNKVSYHYLSSFVEPNSKAAGKVIDKITYGYNKEKNYNHFEILFDYDAESPDDKGYLAHNQTATLRKDPFSSYEKGFCIRNELLCRSIRIYHRFDELGETPKLVSGTYFNYDEKETITYLKAVKQVGYYERNGKRFTKSTPTTVFSYTSDDLSYVATVSSVGLKDGDKPSKQLLQVLNEQNYKFSENNTKVTAQNSFWRIEDDEKSIFIKDKGSFIDLHDPKKDNKLFKSVKIENLSGYLNDQKFQLIDLYQEGIDGILYNDGSTILYFRPNGNGEFSSAQLLEKFPLLNKPSYSLLSLEGDGQLQLYASDLRGYHDFQDGQWSEFKLIESSITSRNELQEMIDVTGDGRLDIIVFEGDSVRVYPSQGKKGYKNPIYQKVPKDLPNQRASSESCVIRFADMFGDGKSHLVKIENGNVECWPNLGYGKFGEKITFKNAPYFRDGFDAKRLYFADIDGSGTTDFVYAHHDSLSIYYNNSGNSFSHEFKLDLPIEYSQISRIEFADILGNGTNCLLLTYLDQNLRLQHVYYDFYNNTKPHLLKQIDNNMGNITRLYYASSTKFYLDDRENRKEWVTSLPFPVQVIEKIETIDNIANSRLTNKFKYHHGFYDYREKEFRGFGLVETWDTEDFCKCDIEEKHYIAPVYTKTWYHTGSYKKSEDLIESYRKEFYQGDEKSLKLVPHTFDSVEIEDDKRQSYRALQGQMLRKEVYGLDNNSLHPYSVTESSACVKLLRSSIESSNPEFKHGIFFVNLQETISYHYEKNPNDPRIQHEFVLEIDDYRNVLKSIAVTYPRRVGGGHSEQQKLYASLECNSFINNIEEFYLLGVNYSSQSFELGGLNGESYISIDELRSHVENALNNKIKYEESLGNTAPQARLLAETNNYYWNKEQTNFLPLGEVTQQALLHHIEAMAFSDSQIKEVFANKIKTDKELEDLGYKKINDSWCAPSAVQYYHKEDKYYLADKVVEFFGAETRVIYDDYSLLPIKTILKVTYNSNYETTAEYDYQRLAPIRLIDKNDNISEVILNPLGVVIASSVYGTENGQKKGDKPLSEYKVRKDISFDDVLENPEKYLQNATSFFYYDLDAWRRNGQPVHVVNLQRESHVSESQINRIRKTVVHMDGFGRNLETELFVDHGKWLSSGRVVYNNKEKEIKKYEPFYSNSPYYELEESVANQGVSSTYYYDPLLRNIRIENPKGFYSKVEFSPWMMSSFDFNDTIEDSDYYTEFMNKWNSADEQQKKALENEKDAIDKALKHKNTPKIEHLDTLGRKFLEIEILRKDGNDIELKTHVKLDIQGNELENADPRFYGQEGIKNFRHVYAMSGLLKTIGVDAGETYSLSNVAGSKVYDWDGKGSRIYTEYDKLQRPVRVKVTDTDLNLKDNVVERFFYSENVQDKATNRYGTLIEHYDQAGLTKVEENDFKGQTIKTSYYLRKNYKQEANWIDVDSVTTNHQDIESEDFKSNIKYDALGQVIEKKDPQDNAHVPIYDIAGRVKQIRLRKKDETPKTYVSNIDYNAKGQRETIIYGNGVITNYTYDEKTFRLIKLESIKENKKLQDIQYIDDPIGNITRIIDNSYKNIFQNSNADAKSDYEYDSLYRLTKATGREHPGINGKDNIITPIPHINDQNGITNYTEFYDFDNAGNITKTRHTGARNFTNEFYISNKSNRSLPILDGIAVNESDIDAKYDESGNLLQINNSQKLSWNYRDNISHVDIVTRSDGKNDSEYYVYDSGGKRVRKVTETYQKENHTVVDKIYFGDMEITRKYQASLKEEKYTIHISDDENKVALHTYWTKHDEYGTEGKNRYQLPNHLDSVSLELNDNAEIITYEEYLPFGGTALIAGKTVREVTEKEYRYSGKERDSSTGLYYYGMRYYAPWLARWINPDPAGTVDGLNLYMFVGGNPVNSVDVGGMMKVNYFIDSQSKITRLRSHSLSNPNFRRGQKKKNGKISLTKNIVLSNSSEVIVYRTESSISPNQKMDAYGIKESFNKTLYINIGGSAERTEEFASQSRARETKKSREETKKLRDLNSIDDKEIYKRNLAAFDANGQTIRSSKISERLATNIFFGATPQSLNTRRMESVQDRNILKKLDHFLYKFLGIKKRIVAEGNRDYLKGDFNVEAEDIIEEGSDPISSGIRKYDIKILKEYGQNILGDVENSDTTKAHNQFGISRNTLLQLKQEVKNGGVIQGFTYHNRRRSEPNIKHRS